VSSIWSPWPAEETEETSIRHGLCGEPSPQTGAEQAFTAPRPPTFITPGSGTLTVTMTVTAHHRGHFEFRVCDLSTGDLSQTCLNEHLLVRTAGDGEVSGSPIDSLHPERYYLPPNGPGQYSATYDLPQGLYTPHAVLQMVYVTANSCNPPDYHNFHAQHPELSGWWQSTLQNCGVSMGGSNPYPEEFWNCADLTLAIPPAVSESNTPSVTPTVSDTPSVTSSVSVTPSNTPSMSDTPSATPTLSVSSSPRPSVGPGCSNCWGGGHGVCQQENTVCWPLVQAPGTGSLECPIRSTLCDGTGVPASTTPASSPSRSPAPSSAPSSLPTPATSSAPAPSSSPVVSPAPSTAPPPTPPSSSFRALTIGYFTNWAQYRPAPHNFKVSDVDPTGLTHAVFAFAKMTPSWELEAFEWNDVVDWNPSSGSYYQFNNDLKAVNPELKTLLAVGGWNFNTPSSGTAHLFSTMVASSAARSTFVDSTISFLREHGFDGLDLDWEYPSYAPQGGQPEDKENYLLLVQDLAAAFEAEATATGNDKLLLSMAVSANPSVLEAGYRMDANGLSKYLDWVGLMTYDLEGSWNAETGSHTNIVGVRTAIDTWIQAGTPASKLVVGLATYGRSWMLPNPAPATGIGAAAWGAGTPGPFTSEGGFLAAYEIQAKLESGEWVAEEDFDSASMYAYGPDGRGTTTWVSYDSAETLLTKASLTDSLGLAGVMVWAVDLDDGVLMPALSEFMRQDITPCRRMLRGYAAMSRAK